MQLRVFAVPLQYTLVPVSQKQIFLCLQRVLVNACNTHTHMYTHMKNHVLCTHVHVRASCKVIWGMYLYTHCQNADVDVHCTCVLQVRISLNMYVCTSTCKCRLYIIITHNLYMYIHVLISTRRWHYTHILMLMQ